METRVINLVLGIVKNYFKSFGTDKFSENANFANFFFRFSESFTATSDGWKCCVNPVCLYITKSLGFICRSSVINSALSLLIAFLFETRSKNCWRFQCGNPISVISNIKKKLVFLRHLAFCDGKTKHDFSCPVSLWLEALIFSSSSAVCLIR